MYSNMFFHYLSSGSRGPWNSCKCINSSRSCKRVQGWSSTSSDELWSAFKGIRQHLSSFESLGQLFLLCLNIFLISKGLEVRICVTQFHIWPHFSSLLWVSFVLLQSEEDFYVRYYTLQLLTALLTNSPTRYIYLLGLFILFLFLFMYCLQFSLVVDFPLKVAGSNSQYSSWYNSTYGHAYGSWGILPPPPPPWYLYMLVSKPYLNHLS